MLDRKGHPAVAIAIDEHGAWNGSYQTAPRRETSTIDGQTATTGDFTAGNAVLGCCVPLPAQ